MFWGRPLAVEARTEGGPPQRVPLDGSGSVRLGALEVGVEVRQAGPGGSVAWWMANGGDTPLAVDAVALVADLGRQATPLRFFRHGYQSWSPSGVAVLGVDRDPSLHEDSIPLVRGIFHADAGVAGPAELRSEGVTLLRSGNGPVTLVGFEGGIEHDGTLRLRPTGAVPDGSDGAELAAEAFLGGAVLAPGERRTLHPVVVDGEDEPSSLLERWAARVGAAGSARAGAPYLVGWCSWYHYFHEVTESDIRENLTRAAEWPFDVFQVDDGWQSAIGDWLTTSERFPSPLDNLAGDIAASGRTPGIWMAPFLAVADADVVKAHPTWLAQWFGGGKALIGSMNPAWGGFALTLDTTSPEVLAHLEHVAATLVGAGYPYLKLDFLYAAALPGVYHDPTRTPAQRVRAGLAAIRKGAGDEAFLLGCGCPLLPAVGIVDAMRIGPDVAPSWQPAAETWIPPGYPEVVPSTANAWADTLARSFQHRRLWLNDPDCLMLRTTSTGLSPAAVRAWALAVGLSGGLALVSDDLALLGADAEALLEEVVAIGRQADAEAVEGRPPRCDDLMERAVPERLRAAGMRLVGDVAAATARIEAVAEA